MLDEENRVARAAYMTKTHELDVTIVVGNAKTIDLFGKIQRLEAQLAALRTGRTALEATTHKLTETRATAAQDAGPVYDAFEK